MTPKSEWRTSVDAMLRIFRDGVIALIPIAERARMSWREPEAYDDWDDICAAIYEAIVIRSLDFADGGSSSLVPRYDSRLTSYNQNNFISDANIKTGAAFVCFETTIDPFDTCLFAILDDDQNVVGQRRTAVSSANFVFCRRDRNTAQLDIIEMLNVSA